MADFETKAVLDVEVSRQAKRDVRRELEELGTDLTFDVSGGSGRSETSQQLDEIIDLLDEPRTLGSGGGGGGGGLGGGGGGGGGGLLGNLLGSAGGSALTGSVVGTAGLTSALALGAPIAGGLALNQFFEGTAGNSLLPQFGEDEAAQRRDAVGSFIDNLISGSSGGSSGNAPSTTNRTQPTLDTNPLNVGTGGAGGTPANRNFVPQNQSLDTSPTTPGVGGAGGTRVTVNPQQSVNVTVNSRGIEEGVKRAFEEQTGKIVEETVRRTQREIESAIAARTLSANAGSGAVSPSSAPGDF